MKIVLDKFLFMLLLRDNMCFFKFYVGIFGENVGECVDFVGLMRFNFFEKKYEY